MNIDLVSNVLIITTVVVLLYMWYLSNKRMKYIIVYEKMNGVGYYLIYKKIPLLGYVFLERWNDVDSAYKRVDEIKKDS